MDNPCRDCQVLVDEKVGGGDCRNCPFHKQLKQEVLEEM